MARTAKKRTVAARKRTSQGSKKQTKSKPSTATNTTRILNCIPSRDTENDWSFDTALAAGLAGAAAIPEEKDLRAHWWSINDQGSTGSCVGWATADSVLRWHFVKAGRLQTGELLSPRFIWMAAKETDEFVSRPTTFIESDGTSLKAALDVARKFGSVRDNILPFGSGKLYSHSAQTFYAIASQFRIARYINLGSDLVRWRRWIAESGPILTRLNCDTTWMKAADTNGRLASYDPFTAQGGHAIALVGYDINNFIVRNSWGTGWGQKGFAFASNLYAKEAFTEAYGVQLT
jgi:Papain family cysteine protease